MLSIDNIALEELFQRAKAGDEASLTSLYSIVRVRLLALTRYKVRSWSREDHEDLVQETMAIFSRDLQKIEHNPLIYAHSILQKRIWNEMDKAHRSRQASLEPFTSGNSKDDQPNIADSSFMQDGSVDIERDIEDKERVERVWQAIQSLNHEFCKPLLTGIIQGLEVSELWEKFSELDPNLSRNTFYKRVFDCRKRLLAILKGTL